MRVLFDARTVGREFSGVGNYVLELVRAFAALDVDVEFLLCVHGESRLRELPLDRRFAFLETRVSHESHPQGDLWEELVLPRRAARHGADVIHGPAFLIPTGPSRAAKVVTVHDLVAFTHPGTIPWKYSLYMRWLIRRAVRAAARVITVSERARREVARRLAVPSQRLDMIPHGVAGRFRPEGHAEIERVRVRYSLPHPYLLFVGNLEPRKNLPGLVRAFRLVRERLPRPTHLVVAGKIAWKSAGLLAELGAPDLAHHVRTTGYVEPEDLPALYAGAEALVFPSLEEGFGLPVLEAMACGTPVIASDVGAVAEVAGDAAALVDPGSPESIANGILHVLTDPARSADLARRGLARAQCFSWEKTARETLASYERASAPERPSGGGAR
ncbi:MAG: glycosyltransferase family 1 protein [bacterium]